MSFSFTADIFMKKKRKKKRVYQANIPSHGSCAALFSAEENTLHIKQLLML